MKYKMIINCTKEHLEKALYCGIDDSKLPNKKYNGVSGNCWISVAVQDIFPTCNVGIYLAPALKGGYNHSIWAIFNYTRRELKVDQKSWNIKLPKLAYEKIREFDSSIHSGKSLNEKLENRRKLQPFSFEIEFDQNTLEIIMECNGFKSMQQFEEKIFAAPHLKLEHVQS